MNDCDFRARTVASRPSVETDAMRSPALGYESIIDGGTIRCLAHGYPTPLARWHHHAEYELHLIVATCGVAFVGEWSGEFEPGHVVLCGPWLPHNWISLAGAKAAEPVARRDLVIQFRHEPLLDASRAIPELQQLPRLMAQAQFGIEFKGVEKEVANFWEMIHRARGIQRFGLFCELLSVLDRCNSYRLLSTSSPKADVYANQIQRISNDILIDAAQDFDPDQIALSLGISEGHFQRLFRQHAGMTFNAYLTQTRVGAACRLLIETSDYIHAICYQVGFNNIANFNRRFKDIKGETPSAYRRRLGKS